MGEIVSLERAVEIRKVLKKQNKKVVFTNGTFDLLHRGHVEYLTKAKKMGDVLFVGLNSDLSVHSIKGDGRPVIPEDDRAYILVNILCVDYVIIFTEETPIHLIRSILPDILVKGADWDVEKIVGKEIVEEHGGRVVNIELTPGRSSTSVIETILHRASMLKK